LIALQLQKSFQVLQTLCTMLCTASLPNGHSLLSHLRIHACHLPKHRRRGGALVLRKDVHAQTQGHQQTKAKNA
jgi:hypothetical protein